MERQRDRKRQTETQRERVNEESEKERDKNKLIRGMQRLVEHLQIIFVEKCFQFAIKR